MGHSGGQPARHDRHAMGLLQRSVGPASLCIRQRLPHQRASIHAGLPPQLRSHGIKVCLRRGPAPPHLRARTRVPGWVLVSCQQNYGPHASAAAACQPSNTLHARPASVPFTCSNSTGVLAASCRLTVTLKGGCLSTELRMSPPSAACMPQARAAAHTQGGGRRGLRQASRHTYALPQRPEPAACGTWAWQEAGGRSAQQQALQPRRACTSGGLPCRPSAAAPTRLAAAESQDGPGEGRRGARRRLVAQQVVSVHQEAPASSRVVAERCSGRAQQRHSRSGAGLADRKNATQRRGARCLCQAALRLAAACGCRCSCMRSCEADSAGSGAGAAMQEEHMPIRLKQCTRTTTEDTGGRQGNGRTCLAESLGTPGGRAACTPPQS